MEYVFTKYHNDTKSRRQKLFFGVFEYLKVERNYLQSLIYIIIGYESWCVHVVPLNTLPFTVRETGRVYNKQINSEGDI